MFHSLYIGQDSKVNIDMDDDCVTDLNEILRSANRGSDIDMDKSLGNVEKSELFFFRHLGPEMEAKSPAKKFKDLRTMRPRL